MSRDAVFTEWHDQPLEETLYQCGNTLELSNPFAGCCGGVFLFHEDAAGDV